MKKRGIHIRILIAAFLLICAATFTLDVVCIHITSGFMYKRFKDRVSFLAKYLALNSEVGVLIGDKNGLKSLALNLLGEEDVAKVVILDNHNNELVNQTRKAPGPLSMVETPVLFKKARDENLLFGTEHRTPFGEEAVTGTEYIGKVRIYFSTHGIDQLMMEITRQFIWCSVGLAILAGLFFYFISRPIVVEVTRLAKTARQVAKGDMELRAEPGHLPETKELALSFNSMLDSLAKSREELSRVSREMMKQKSLAERGRFSMMVAHEVKNPLGIIKSSLDILKRDLEIPKDNVMTLYIEDEIKRLNHLIEDFLMFAKPSEPNFRKVDLNRMLKDILERFMIQCADSSLTIESEITPDKCSAHADRDLLTRGLGNIVKNAVEANEREGTLFVRAAYRNDIWIVDIEDQGGGVDNESLEKIFEPFFTTRSKGTGLGLAFAMQVVSAHGGTIIARNTDKGGACFRVRIPAAN